MAIRRHDMAHCGYARNLPYHCLLSPQLQNVLRDAVCDPGCRVVNGVARKMRIPDRDLDFSMLQQPADHGLWFILPMLGNSLRFISAGIGFTGARFAWPSKGGASRAVRADPEVVTKLTRRQFTAQYRLRILEESERDAESGHVGRLLRREGLYSSHLTAWRKARREGSLQGLSLKTRGAKPAKRNPLDAKVRELEAKVARLEKELATAHTILEVQGKVAGLLGFRFEDGKDC